MPISFSSADAAILSTRTLLYTCPAATQGILFSGTISNIDNALQADHNLTLEVQKVDTSYVVSLNKIIISYNSSLNLPKIVLSPGEKIYLTADLASVLSARVSIVQKT